MLVLYKIYLTEYVHIHVPKTGGSWVNKFLEENELGLIFSEHSSLSCLFPGWWEAWRLGFGPIGATHPYFVVNYADSDIPPVKLDLWKAKETYPGRFEKCCLFSICRNPFDWLVSYYYSGSFTRGFDGIADIHGIRSWQEFVEKFCDPEFRWFHFGLHKFLYYQILDDNGFFGIDWILRTEKLKDAVDEMLLAQNSADRKTLDNHWDRFSVDHSIRDSGNVSAKREHKDHRMYYDDRLREMAEKRFKLELDIFKYDFDGPTDDSPTIIPECGVRINFTDRHGINYGELKPPGPIGSVDITKKIYR